MIAPAKITWAFAAIVALGIALALPGLNDLPVTQGDDTAYFETARSLSLLLGWGGDNWANIIEGTADVGELSARYEREGIKFIFPYYSKPLFDFICLVAIGIWGPQPHAILYANLLFFAVAIWLIAWVGMAFFCAEVGLLAALFFATSGSALVYARTGMAHIASLAFFLLGAHLYLHFCRRESSGGVRQFWVVGAIWGMCIAIHPNLLPYVGLCGMAEFVSSWRLRGRVLALQRSFWLAVGGAGVALSIEAIYRAIGLFFGRTLSAASAWLVVPFRTYFEQIALHADAVIAGEVTILQKIYTYLLLFWAHEGLLVCVLIGLSIVFWLRDDRKDAKILFILILFWVPLLFFICSKNQAVYRYAAGGCLPAALLAAVALERLLLKTLRQWSWPPQRVLIWVIFAVAAVNIVHVRPIYAVESAWASTAQWLKLHDEVRVVSASGNTLWAINGIKNIDPQRGAEGARYIALYKRYERAGERELMQQLDRDARPVFTAPHRRPDKLLEIEFLVNNLVFDGLEALPGIGDYIYSMRLKALKYNYLHFIEVYELNGVVGEVGKRDRQSNGTGSEEETKHHG